MAGRRDADGPLRDHLHRLMGSPSDVWAGTISGQLYNAALESLTTPDQCPSGVAAAYSTSLAVPSFMAHHLSGPKTLSAIVQNYPPSSSRFKKELARAMWGHPSALAIPSVREWMLSWPWAVGQYMLQLPCWPQGSESSDRASFLLERATRGNIVSQHPARKNKNNADIWVTPEILGSVAASDLFEDDHEARQRVQAVSSLDIISQLAQSPVSGVRLATQMQLVPLP